jgi:DNA-binding beta-propeller fold protein YncE
MRSAFCVVIAATALLSPGAEADGGGSAASASAGGGTLWTTSQNRVVGINPASGAIRSVIVTGAGRDLIGADSRSVWVLSYPRRLVAADVASRHVRMRLRLGHDTYSGYVGSGAVWLPSFNAGTLTKIDARTGVHIWERRIEAAPQAVTLASGAVWIASTGSWHKGTGGAMVPDGRGIVSRLDPLTGDERVRIRVGRGPGALAADKNDLWVLNGRGLDVADTVDRIDMRTNRVVARIPVPHWASDIACARGICWVVSAPKSAGGVVTRIDGRTNRTKSRAIPKSWVPAAVVNTRGKVWVADPGVGELIRIEPDTLRVIKRVKIPRR